MTGSHLQAAAVRLRFCVRFENGNVSILENMSCESHGEGKETYLCSSTDRARFRLFPSTAWIGRAVWIGSKYGFVSSRMKVHQRATRKTVFGQSPMLLAGAALLHPKNAVPSYCPGRRSAASDSISSCHRFSMSWLCKAWCALSQ